MPKIVFIIFLTFSVGLVHAQVKVDAKPTGKHARAINQAKRTKEEAKQRKEAVKEQKRQVREYKKKVKQHKKAKRAYKQKYDSIKSTKIDSLDIELLSKEDSLAISEEILAKTNLPPEYKELIREPPVLTLDSSRVQHADSVAIQRGEQELEQVASEYIPDEMMSPDDPLSQTSNPLDGNGIPGKLPSINRPNPNLVKPDQARELFKKVDPEQFQDAQEEIQKLKKKYSELPDTRYPEEGTKRNSLEEVPFSKRVYLGGNISLQSTDPLILNTNLQIGYWINKKWLAGVGLIFREQFSNDSTTLVGDGYGYSFFTRYDIPKGFFAWTELERQVNKSLLNNEQNAVSRWQSAYLLGVGREFKIGFVQMMSMILYDFNYRENDLNARPWVFRLGVRFNEKP